MRRLHVVYRRARSAGVSAGQGRVGDLEGRGASGMEMGWELSGWVYWVGSCEKGCGRGLCSVALNVWNVR